MRKREAVLSLFMKTGVFSLCRIVRSRRLLVVNYHRILDANEENPFDDGVVTCSPAVFETQVSYLSRHRTIISMQDFVDFLQNGGGLPSRPTLLTFDDGYADNYRNAFPVLKRYRAPACFYLPANRFLNRRLEWWDHIAFAVKHASQKSTTVQFGGAEHSLSLDSPQGREAATDRLIDVAKQTGAHPSELYPQLGLEPPPRDLESGEIMGDEDVLSILEEPGFSIGAHSVSHAVLTTLSAEDQEYELAESRRFLVERFGAQVDTFAYPVGDDSHYDAVSKRAAAKAGYAAAFNFRRKATDIDLSHVDRFDIDRVGAMRTAGAMFQARASGFFMV